MRGMTVVDKPTRQQKRNDASGVGCGGAGKCVKNHLSVNVSYLRRMGAVLLNLLLFLGCAQAFDTPPPSKAEAMRTGEKQESSVNTDAHGAALEAIVDPVQWRRVHLVYRPSFSPHPKISYTWSRRGEWWMASAAWTWPPPLPEDVESALMRDDEAARWQQMLVRALRALPGEECTEEQMIERGHAHLYMEDRDTEKVHCVRWSELAEAGQLPKQALKVMEFATHAESVDRWTHPFWLVDASSFLRLELKGTAELWIDGEAYGRVNGVLRLRLPVGKRVLTLQPLDDRAPQDLEVFLRKNETTIVRISMEDDAMITVPSWSQPRR